MAGAADFRVAVVRRIYAEVLSLTLEARNYLGNCDRAELGLSLIDSLRMTAESLRVTTRLTQVMAWALLWRAVEEGEMSAAEARSQENRLCGEDVCLDLASAEEMALVPGPLRSLLDRSHALYVRVLRLEHLDGLRSAVAMEPRRAAL